MKDLGELQYYLGVKVTRTEDSITVDQERYTLDVLQKYAHLLRGFESKNYNTPMEHDLNLMDLMYSTTFLCQFLGACFNPYSFFNSILLIFPSQVVVA